MKVKSDPRSNRTPVRLRVAHHDAIEALAQSRGIAFSEALAEVIDRGLAAEPAPKEDPVFATLERALLRALRQAAKQAAEHRRPRR